MAHRVVYFRPLRPQEIPEAYRGMGLQERGTVSKMNSVLIQIWFVGDVGPASIEYTKSFNGNAATAHNRFTKDAMRKFPNWHRIAVKAVI